MDIQLEKKKGIQKKHLPYIAGGSVIILLLAWVIFGNHAATMRVDSKSINIADVTYGEFNDYIRLNGRVQPISIVLSKLLFIALVSLASTALFGAAGEGDIGAHFPPSDESYRGIDSCLLLAETRDIVTRLGLGIEYADMTIVAQKPKLAAYLPAMREKIAAVLEIPADRVNVKATTEEKMGFTGREEGIAAHAVCLLNE